MPIVFLARVLQLSYGPVMTSCNDPDADAMTSLQGCYVHAPRHFQALLISVCNRHERSQSGAGIIGGLLAYVVINGLNWIIDKISEFGHWTMTGNDVEVPVMLDRSVTSRMASNTGTAGLVRADGPLNTPSFLFRFSV